jgi:hypothetical protein
MYAKWIPEALDRLEALLGLPEPPSIHAVAGARRQIAACQADLEFPDILAEGGGVEVRWGENGFYIAKFGEYMGFTKF